MFCVCSRRGKEGMEGRVRGGLLSGSLTAACPPGTVGTERRLPEPRNGSPPHGGTACPACPTHLGRGGGRGREGGGGRERSMEEGGVRREGGREGEEGGRGGREGEN